MPKQSPKSSTNRGGARPPQQGRAKRSRPPRITSAEILRRAAHQDFESRLSRLELAIRMLQVNNNVLAAFVGYVDPESEEE